MFYLLRVQDLEPYVPVRQWPPLASSAALSKFLTVLVIQFHYFNNIHLVALL